MKRQKTFFLYNDIVFQLNKPEITVKKIKIAQVKFENEEYKVIRKEFNEDFYNIEKSPYGWEISEKE